MRRKPHSPLQPGLFDELDDIKERQEGNFELFAPEEMRRIASLHSHAAPGIDDMPPLEADPKVFFMSFGSGSSGNCAYVGDRNGGFLIDAGVDARKVVKELHFHGIAPEKLYGIILTHDHHDHIAQAYQLLRSYKQMKLYCTLRTFNGILRRHNISRRIRDYHSPIYKEFTFRLGNFGITPFEVLHDSADNTGFFITNGAVRLAVATDLGSITPRVDHYMRQATSIVLEANYDHAMLVGGAYPEHLKARILAPNGHLDNRMAASFVADIYTPLLKNVFLCHLSHDNNTPSQACGTMAEALALKGIVNIGDALPPLPSEGDRLPPQINIVALPRYDTTPLYIL